MLGSFFHVEWTALSHHILLVSLQNSVRHSLSLGHYFRKTASHGAGAASKPKGNLWEIIPDKAEALRKEVDSFVAPSIISTQQRLINGTFEAIVNDCMHTAALRC